MYMEKYNIESLGTDRIRELYERRLTNKMKEVDLTECDVENCWGKIKKCIHEAATEAIEKRKINWNAWFRQEVKELTELKKKSYVIYKGSPILEQYNRYAEIRNRVNSRIKTIKKEHWIQLTSDMDPNHDIYKTQRMVWKMLKNRKKPINEFVQIKGTALATWERYFRELYDAEETDEIEGYQTEDNITITETEVLRRLRNTKNRKTPRPFVDLTKAFDPTGRY